MKIMIIEDDADIGELLEYNLRQEGYQTRHAVTGREGLEATKRERPDLIILDLMLPDMGGLDVCKALKADEMTRPIPVLMLTAKSDEMDRIIGLEVGADDYLTKPFSTREVILRIKAILKRSKPASGDDGSEAFTFGVLEVDPEKFRVNVERQRVQLTALEFKLLQFLHKTRGRVATRDILLDQVWGYDAAVGTRTVDAHIKRLREKLGVAGTYIETIRGLGYRFVETME